MKTLLPRAIFQNHVKTSRHRNNKLVQSPVCMPTALRAAWNVIKIINALNLKWYMAPSFNKSEVAPRISNLREINNSAFGQIHELTSSTSVLFFIGVLAAFRDLVYVIII